MCGLTIQTLWIQFRIPFFIWIGTNVILVLCMGKESSFTTAPKRKNVTLARIKKRTKAHVKAKLKAEAEFWKSKIGREWSDRKSFSHAVGLLLDKIDPVDTAVFIGTTFLVYKTLEKAEDVIKNLTTISIGPRFELGPRFRVGPKAPLGGGPFPIYEGFEVLKHFGVTNVTLVFLSMLIAYMIMRHGAEILKAFSGGIVGIAKMLIPAPSII